jgi:4a-hydroxytetrahydrobiopterin dehydratase
MAIAKLSAAEIEAKLADLQGWTLQGGKLHKDYRFTDFVAAFGFMTRVALHAEAQQHHPEWHNVYNRLAVDLTTHDAGGISEKDFALARIMDSLL